MSVQEQLLLYILVTNNTPYTYTLCPNGPRGGRGLFLTFLDITLQSTIHLNNVVYIVYSQAPPFHNHVHLQTMSCIYIHVHSRGFGRGRRTSFAVPDFNIFIVAPADKESPIAIPAERIDTAHVTFQYIQALQPTSVAPAVNP